MGKMFGERINQFVLACDIMTPELFFNLLDIIASYLSDELDIFHLFVFYTPQGGTELSDRL